MNKNKSSKEKQNKKFSSFQEMIESMNKNNKKTSVSDNKPDADKNTSENIYKE